MGRRQFAVLTLTLVALGTIALIARGPEPRAPTVVGVTADVLNRAPSTTAVTLRGGRQVEFDYGQTEQLFGGAPGDGCLFLYGSSRRWPWEAERPWYVCLSADPAQPDGRHFLAPDSELREMRLPETLRVGVASGSWEAGMPSLQVVEYDDPLADQP